MALIRPRAPISHLVTDAARSNRNLCRGPSLFETPKHQLENYQYQIIGRAYCLTSICPTWNGIDGIHPLLKHAMPCGGAALR